MHVLAAITCNVTSWFAAPSTRPITCALLPAVATTPRRLGAFAGATSTVRRICSVLVKATRDGLANFSTNDCVAPLCNSAPATSGLTYGRPSGWSPALLASVIPAGSPPTATAIGASTGASDEFLSVTVESNVLVVRLSTSPERVIANWPVMSCVSACAAALSARLSATTAHRTRWSPICRRTSRMRPLRRQLSKSTTAGPMSIDTSLASDHCDSGTAGRCRMLKNWHTRYAPRSTFRHFPRFASNCRRAMWHISLLSGQVIAQ